jgi:aminoglycoside phosphotransferase (APT) family kinase protein
MMNRTDIYNWKCDRPSAFHSLQNNGKENERQLIELSLQKLLEKKFKSDSFTLNNGNGQGNHLTYLAEYEGKKYFIRIENGPEKDTYMMVEGRIIEEVRKLGVPAPQIFESDTTRKNVDFAYQIMEYLEYPDLNTLHKSKQLDISKIAVDIGKNIATWQSITPPGFGLFNTEKLMNEGRLIGLHEQYIDYYFLNMHTHLRFLVSKHFLTVQEAKDLMEIIYANKKYLQFQQGCLVHKDLALWNILGVDNKIKAIIDWDDSIAGDPTDDLSLLACFYSDDVIQAAIDGYTSVKELPEHFFPRFHLHLLRNMIVKAVIRVGANYFEKTDDFFLIDAGSMGSSLEQITREKIFMAYNMLNKKMEKIFL